MLSLILVIVSLVGSADSFDFSSCNDDIDCGLSLLNNAMNGYLVTESDPNGDDYSTYSDTRLAYFNLLDPKPLAIIFVNGEEDVQSTISFITYFDICFSYHSSAISHSDKSDDWSVKDGCIVINFRLMKQADIYFDNESGHYVANVEAGLMNFELRDILKEYALNNGINLLLPMTGSGTISFGGNPSGAGYGKYTRLLGPICYYFKSVTIITNVDEDDGTSEVIYATHTNEHKNLLWAIAGGGPGIFGFVIKSEFYLTEFDFDESIDTTLQYGWDSSTDEANQDSADLLEIVCQNGENYIQDDLNPQIFYRLITSQSAFGYYLYITDTHVNAWTKYQEIKTDIESQTGLTDSDVVRVRERNFTLWDGPGGTSASTLTGIRNVPSLSRYIFGGYTEENCQKIKTLQSYLVNAVNSVNNEFGYGISYSLSIIPRGHGKIGENIIDPNKIQFSLPVRDPNLLEIDIFISWNRRGATDEEIQEAIKLGELVEEQYGFLGWNKRYTNIPSFNLAVTDYDWKDSFYGFNNEEYVYRRLSGVKCEYDEDWFFDTTIPVPPDCDQSADAEDYFDSESSSDSGSDSSSSQSSSSGSSSESDSD